MIVNGYIFITSSVLSFIISYLLIKYWNVLSIGGIDSCEGVQKIHVKGALRVGSIGLLIPFLFIGYIFNIFSEKIIQIIPFILFIWTLGFIEDLTLSVSAKARLIIMTIITVLMIYFTEFSLFEVQSLFLTKFFSIKVIAISFTLIGILATMNSWNFIDGLNGLSSGLAITSITTLSIICFKYNIDYYNFGLLLASSVLGFWALNIYSGRIFLGDSGSLSLGFTVSIFGIICVSTIPEISAWSVFLIIIYPATELIMSFFRRVLFGKNPFIADKYHLHSILYSLLNQKLSNKNFVNSLSGFFLTFLGSIPAIACIKFQNNEFMLVLLSFIFFLKYNFIYFFLLWYLKNKSKVLL